MTVRRRSSTTGVVDSTVNATEEQYVLLDDRITRHSSDNASNALQVTDGGTALRGPGLPSSGRTVGILRVYVFRR